MKSSTWICQKPLDSTKNVTAPGAPRSGRLPRSLTACLWGGRWRARRTSPRRACVKRCGAWGPRSRCRRWPVGGGGARMLREGAALLTASTPPRVSPALGSGLALGANLCFPTEPDTLWFHKRERVYINIITGTILRVEQAAHFVKYISVHNFISRTITAENIQRLHCPGATAQEEPLSTEGRLLPGAHAEGEKVNVDEGGPSPAAPALRPQRRQESCAGLTSTSRTLASSRPPPPARPGHFVNVLDTDMEAWGTVSTVSAGLEISRLSIV